MGCEDHGRYPNTFEELDYYVDTTAIRARLSALAESSVTLFGTSVQWARVSCSLEVTPAVQDMETTVCSGSASD